jgi:hypothetical protein
MRGVTCYEHRVAALYWERHVIRVFAHYGLNYNPIELAILELEPPGSSARRRWLTVRGMLAKEVRQRSRLTA